ncbi:COX15/CtaA family protein [Paenibacillus sp. MBLB4367]|uniref:COX15/CtaA family protein n=1 Tax=Paenibacillus sp. MBLB4367 TaxID=3384767 RepID=UPI00390810CD
MFLVLLMGALVTKTESGRGCGDDWPLCNGKFVPAYTIDSMIEYSHRFVTGIVGLIVFAAFLVVLRRSKRLDAKIHASGVLFFTIVQAALGAMAVMWPQSSAVLALHFGISLLAFAFTVLLYFAIREENKQDSSGAGAKRPQPSGWNPGAVQVAKGFRRLVWLTLAYCYVVVYLGAYIRHTESSGGCVGWPLCNGEVVPELSGATGVVFMHRVGALLLFIVIAFLAYASSKSDMPKRIKLSGKWALYLVALQVFSGAFVTFAFGSDWYLLASLLHTVIISCLFSILCYLSVIVIPAGSTKRTG